MKKQFRIKHRPHSTGGHVDQTYRRPRRYKGDKEQLRAEQERIQRAGDKLWSEFDGKTKE